MSDETKTVVTTEAMSTELVPANDQIDIEELIRNSRAKNTWRVYERSCLAFEAWCRDRGFAALPASPAALQGYVAHLVKAGRAYATINAQLAAIASAHSARGLVFDRASVKSVMKGVRRTIGNAQRQARALVADDLKAIIQSQPDGSRGLRNTLLLSLGFAGALRRSELVGLDWMKRGSGSGYLVRTDKGIEIVLDQSKTAAGEPVRIVIPAADMPTAIAALDAWIAQVGVAAGEPILREVTKGGVVGAGRLSDRSVTRIIKGEVRRRALQVGKTQTEADELANACSGHSLRAGFCTAAAMGGVPEWKIRNRSRHKTAEMVARYVRASEAWTDSGLKGVGF